MTKNKTRRLLGTAIGLLLAASVSSVGQAVHGDTALTYQWVHSNTQPGVCGCFGLNGGGVSASIDTIPHLSAVVSVDGAYEGKGSPTGNTLTLVSYLAGLRFSFRRPGSVAHHRPQPFAQVLLGTAHAGGGVAGAGDGTFAFATRAGGGLDLPLHKTFSVRLIQADYFLTDFANTTNNDQNNLKLGAGAVFRWSR